METKVRHRIITFWAASALLMTGLYACDGNRTGMDRSENEEFVVEVASTNNLEIASGSLGMSHGQNEEVRSFAQHMLDEHSAVHSEMTSLADDKGWTVPTGLLPKHQDQLEELGTLTGAEFDREFTKLMVRSHEEAVDLFSDFLDEDLTKGEIDVELREFALQKLPALESHLNNAKRLRDSIDNFYSRGDTTRLPPDSLVTPRDPMR